MNRMSYKDIFVTCPYSLIIKTSLAAWLRFVPDGSIVKPLYACVVCGGRAYLTHFTWVVSFFFPSRMSLLLKDSYQILVSGFRIPTLCTEW